MRTFIAALACALLPGSVQAQVTLDQAKSAAATVIGYGAQNPLWVCDPTMPDGFNPSFYASERPDVVKLWGGTYLSHYQQYGKAEGTLPCQAQPVSQAQDQAAAATLAAYVAQPVAVATADDGYGRNAARADGWNSAWYAHARPDVVAAKVDLLTHWLSNGRWEGTPPYEGAQPWKPATAADYADAGAPQLVAPDVYVPAGTTDLRIRVSAKRRSGAVLVASERSEDVTSRVQDGYSPFVSVDQPATVMAPSNGGTKEFHVHIGQAFGGHFGVTFADIGSSPVMTPVTATVHVGEPAPDGYVYPDALPAAADVQPSAAVLASKPTVDADLSDPVAQGFSVGGYSLNGMTGYFCTPGSTTQSGKAVDPLPLVTEQGVTARRFLPQDFRTDVVAIPGGYTGWCMGAMGRDDHFVTGYRLTRELLYRYPSQDMAPSWSIGSSGTWPPELDDSEVWTGTDKVGRQFLTFHLAPDGRTRGAGALGIPEGVWIDRLVGRTSAVQEQAVTGAEDAIGMYRQWVRLVGDTGPWRLVYEYPDLLEGQPLQWAANNEGWGGAGGGGPPAQGATPFDAVAAHAYFDLARYTLWKTN